MKGEDASLENADLRRVLRWTVEGWEAICGSLIQNYWAKTGILREHTNSRGSIKITQAEDSVHNQEATVDNLETTVDNRTTAELPDEATSLLRQAQVRYQHIF